eukprot:CAMPEP_0169081924 /NCGR_PEP_ID=MMETSP1015-20121227/11271_1 /TAXON_ID=342587 /ORGANISM="Karlodinium micrum, Strain CCMP2283" /LENGTH=32 /DNA_ID= /DNA_START= /DNA_END= /DNA_ORIENTATION=
MCVQHAQSAIRRSDSEKLTKNLARELMNTGAE